MLGVRPHARWLIRSPLVGALALAVVALDWLRLPFGSTAGAMAPRWLKPASIGCAVTPLPWTFRTADDGVRVRFLLDFSAPPLTGDVRTLSISMNGEASGLWAITRVSRWAKLNSNLLDLPPERVDQLRRALAESYSKWLGDADGAASLLLADGMRRDTVVVGGYAHDAVVLIFAALGLHAIGLSASSAVRAVARRRCLKRGLCPWCSYDRAGVAAAGPCPECGRAPAGSAVQAGAPPAE